MENVRVKLSEKYYNEFLTTQSGKVFYKNPERYGKKDPYVSVDLRDIEISNLLGQRILVIEGDIERPRKIPGMSTQNFAQDSEDPVVELEVKQEKIKVEPKIIRDTVPSDTVVKEVVSKDNKPAESLKKAKAHKPKK